MSNFVLWTVIFSSINVLASVIALANGTRIIRTPGSIAFGVVTSSAWIIWGVYLLARAPA